MKKNLAFISILAVLALTACNGGGNGGKSSSKQGGSSAAGSSSSSSSAGSSTSIALPKYSVKIGDADPITVEMGTPLTKPADPTAPAGKVFYGWRNTANGGQIWNFDAEDLNQVYANVTLEPLFVDASVKEQRFEAELCPDIVNHFLGYEKDSDVPIYGFMSGATYSGGQSGKGLISFDYRDEYEVTGVESIDYIEWETEEEEGICEVNETIDRFKAPAGATLNNAHEDFTEGAFVHFMYTNGDTLTWVVNSDKAADNVTIFARFSAEYGVQDPDTDERYSGVTQTSFPITVNDKALEYGNIRFHNVPNIGQYLTFQDYFLSASVSLKAGTNTIQMKVDNNDTLNGTIASSAPCVDSIKLYSSSNLTWPEARVTNLIDD